MNKPFLSLIICCGLMLTASSCKRTNLVNAEVVSDSVVEAEVVLIDTMLIGDWTADVNGRRVGLSFLDDGVVKPINMGNIKYHAWTLKDGKIALYGKKIDGTRQEALNDTAIINQAEYTMTIMGNKTVFKKEPPKDYGVEIVTKEQ